MRRFILNILLVVSSGYAASAWGGYEHSVIAYSAQDLLSSNAQNNIRKYLDQPIYEYAEWMDYTPLQGREGYEILKNGHCTAVCFDGYLPQNAPYADGQCAGYPYMKEVLTTLKHHRDLPDSLVALHLRCFLHMIGDMHCPGHIMFGNYPEDGSVMSSSYKFGDYRQFKTKCWYGGSHRTIHWLWDTPLQNIHGDWNFEQWRQYLETWPEVQRNRVVEGSIEDYLADSAENAKRLYSLGAEDAKYDVTFYDTQVQEIIFYQIRASIYRLAYILNECFDYAE